MLGKQVKRCLRHKRARSHTQIAGLNCDLIDDLRNGYSIVLLECWTRSLLHQLFVRLYVQLLGVLGKLVLVKRLVVLLDDTAMSEFL